LSQGRPETLFVAPIEDQPLDESIAKDARCTSCGRVFLPGEKACPNCAAGRNRGERERDDDFGDGRSTNWQRMQYMRAYQFIFDSKNWFMNILMGVVCSIIPIVGQIVFHGYLFEVIDSLHEDPDHTDYPDFDFNRFSIYLMRGVWPFLINLLVSVVLVFPVVFGSYALMILGVVVFRETTALVILCMLAAVAIGIGGSFLIALVQFPAMLHAGLAREIRFGELIAFVRDFIAKMWKEELLVILFVTATGMVLFPLGMLVFCVGMYFAGVAIEMAEHHFMFQLYELYLKRGGTPIRRAGSSVAPENEPV
jgi:hypothetical protein